MKWKVGDITVTKVVELRTESGELARLIPDAMPEALLAIDWLRPDFVADDGNFKLILQSFIVETKDALILVDAGIGNGKSSPRFPVFHQLQTDFLDRIVSAGFAPDRFDYIACSHIHVDHIGWNTVLDEGRWLPTFPKARYLFGNREFEHAIGEANVSRGNPDHPRFHQVAIFDESVEPILNAGLAELVADDHEICPGVHFVHSPGHTPGHLSIEISSKGQKALITGDVFYHPCQLEHPEWSSPSDSDRPLSVETRRRVLEAVAETPTLVIGSHWSGPTGFHIKRNGSSFITHPAAEEFLI